MPSCSWIKATFTHKKVNMKQQYLFFNKKQFFVLFINSFIFTALSIPPDMQSSAYNDNAIFGPQFDEPGDIRYTDGIDPTIDSMFPDDDYVASMPSLSELGIRNPQTTPEQIIQLLISLGAVDILKESLYCQTNGLNERSLLDEPLFEPKQCCYQDNWTIGGDFFWNQVNASHLLPHRTAIKYYLNLFGPTFIGRLESSAGTLLPLFASGENTLDIARLLSLFENMSVQERRIGFMFEAMKRWDWLELRLMIPLYYNERNYFFSNQEQENAREFLATQFGGTDAQAEAEFQKNHLISDSVGFGDTRIEFNGEWINRNGFTLKAGIFGTIPTAFSVKRGIVGSHYSKLCQYPVFDFDSLFSIVDQIQMQGGVATQEQQEMAFLFIRNIALGSLDQLSANLLDVQMGNGRHFGFGPYMRLHTPFSCLFNGAWAEHLSLNGRYSIEYQINHKEKVFYKIDPNLADFENRDFTDTAQASENLTFLENEFIRRLYTIALPTQVRPGFIFRWTSSLCYDGCYIDGRLGNDVYIRTKPAFSNICTSPDLLSQINIPAAELFLAYQWKITGGFTGKVERPDHVWYISVNGDYTVSSSGLGRDFTLTFGLEANF